MSTLTVALLTGLYLSLNTIRVVSYIPQMIGIARNKSSVPHVSISTWWFWTGANLATCLYAIGVVNNYFIFFINLGNTIGCFGFTMIVIYKRYIYAGQTYGFLHKLPFLKRQYQEQTYVKADYNELFF